MDWQEIKMEYITNSAVSYRNLAEKYAVSISSISKHAKAEEWKKEREHFANKSNTKIVKDLANKNAQKRIQQITKMNRVADRLLKKLDKAVSICEPEQILKNPKLIRGLTGALLDLRSILELHSELDIKEQEARIDKLRREAERDNAERAKIVVHLTGDTEEYGA